MIELDYMTTRTAAKAWGISQRRVLALCAKDRIEGLARVENLWLIPKGAKKPADARTLRNAKEPGPVVRPFVKWAGGKGQLLDEIRKNYPAGLGSSITKYAEPFVGGGAVLFDILSRCRPKEVYISDVNRELMNAYTVVRDDVHGLIACLTGLQDGFLRLDAEQRKLFYYEKRECFNKLKLREGQTETVELAALFLFLNRTCFNGLYRVNRRGCFNVPMGAYKNPLICDEKNLINVSNALQNVIIYCGDYRCAEKFIDNRTFVYFDPPYRPLNATSAFTSYTEEGFDDEAQVELARFIGEMDEKGAKIVLSNSDPRNTNTGDSFFDDLYAGHRIHRVEAVRAINSNREKRGKIKELLITNY